MVRIKLWLYIRCKVEMTRKHWEAIVREKKMAEEWKEFMTFPEEWRDISIGKNESDECSEKGSNEDVD